MNMTISHNRYQTSDLESWAETPATDDRADDAELMSAIRAGDERALEQLRQRHRPLLTSVVARVLSCEADVEETLQDIFLEIWRMARNCDPTRGEPLGWIVRMSRRRAIDRLRKNVVRHRVGQQLEAEAQANARSQGSGGYLGRDESPVVSNDRRRFLDVLLSSLPIGQREALELNFFGELSQRDIARRTGIPLGTIKTRVELALKKLTLAASIYRADLR